MLKLWPSRRETPAPSTSPDRSLAQRAVIDNFDYKQNFHETEDLLIEFAPHGKSEDPKFRHGFLALADDLSSLDHPGLLKLYSFGEDEGRLFRVWAKRRLCTASSDPVEDFTEKRRQLAQVIEGFRLLHNLGVAVELYSPQFISYDPKQGMFIARFPFLREDSPGRSEFYPYFIDYAAPPEPEDFPADKAFLIQLGVFIGVYLVKEVPFVEPPLVSRWKNAPVVRKSLSLPCPLRSVLERLTELEPDKNYPDLATGLEEVKLALLAGL